MFFYEAEYGCWSGLKNFQGGDEKSATENTSASIAGDAEKRIIRGGQCVLDAHETFL